MKIIPVYNSVISFILMIFLLSGCNASNPLQTKSYPDMLVENCSLINYKNNAVEFILKADKASYYFYEKKSIAENVKLNYNKDENTGAAVNADRAVINTDTNDVDLIGSVKITSSAGNRLFTEKIKIKWHSQDSFLDTDESFKIIRKNGDIITGIGLITDYNLENYEIKKKVYAESANAVDEFKREDDKQANQEK